MSFFGNTWTRIRDTYAARHEPEAARRLAEALWRSTIVFSLAAIIAIIFFGLWEFVLVIGNLSSTNGSASNPPAVLDRNVLQSTLRSFDSRRATLQNLERSGVTVSDPSR